MARAAEPTALHFRMAPAWYAGILWRLAMWLLTAGEALMRLAIRKYTRLRPDEEARRLLEETP